MWDGAVNEELETLLESALTSGATVATCGHGAVALLEVKNKATSDYYIKNKEVQKPLPGTIACFAVVAVLLDTAGTPAAFPHYLISSPPGVATRTVNTRPRMQVMLPKSEDAVGMLE